MTEKDGVVGEVVANKFEVVSDFQPAGDQPAAIAALAKGINRGDRFQTLLGITGSGKSATMAWTIEAVQRPTLILAPNKSLAAQLAQEMKEFFPKTGWNILSVTTTITSQRRTSHRATRSSKRIRQSTMRLIAFVTRRLQHC